MAKAGKALKKVLKDYGIVQNRLAVRMGVARSTVNQWVNEVSDPLAESIPAIIVSLNSLTERGKPPMGEEFLALFLGRAIGE